ncbi:hypothetical protein AEAC466_13300 [Asticcacaulis sp. AC466]|uniref:alpha/beta hydrolase n=1 Tax=Asticcacaulis sp. AC466 TaxID=1282362 RepID=UPI0003C3B914|nr:alpha/beta hydrolase-fold protein [Asticcacaulis sp. AC466]ESQ83222.1 hypothetical protein AEAC466_13300 [Asticcacaulis sp. AC466]
MTTIKALCATLAGLAAGMAGDAFGQTPTVPEPAPCTDYCRSAVDFTPEQAAKHLGDQALAYWVDGNIIRIAARGSGEPPGLCCTFQAQMERLDHDATGTLWGAAYRVPGMDQAIISLMLPAVDDSPRLTYRGPHAPPAPEAVDTLQGHITEIAFDSVNLKAKRDLFIYTPPGKIPADGYPVIYMADGASAQHYAQLLEYLILKGAIRPILLVGIAYGAGPPLVAGGKDQRNREYLPGKTMQLPEYLAHEAFVRDEVMPLAETTFHASHRPQDRMTFGVSSGASWAVSFALRHRGVFGQAAGGSIGMGPSYFDFSHAAPLDLYVEAGRFETPFVKATDAVCRAANAASVNCTLTTLYAGHDWQAWDYAFVETVKRVFKP